MSTRQEIEEVVDEVSRLLDREIGLRPEPSLRDRLRRCIRDDAVVHGHDLGAYLSTLMAGGEVLQNLLNRVTVQETAFFRHPEHFELLAREILPGLRPPVILWSAACANGQEAFSLAMLLDELGIDGRVVASDLSTDALERTVAARYSTRELGGLSPRRRTRHLTRDGDAWLISRNLQNRVSALQHNLLHPLPDQVRSCQVVFCRNVLIYFSPVHARAFLDQVADALPEASLFLGAAETIWQLSSRFETVRSGDTFSYRCRADSPAGTPAIADPDRPGSPLRIRRAPLPTTRAVSRSAESRSAESSSAESRWAFYPPGTVRPPSAPTPEPARTPAAAAFTAAAPSAPSTAATPATPTTPTAAPTAPTADLVSAALLTLAGQRASAAGDAQAAVVAFRKCAYLAPDDPVAHLHLGLALESAGDQSSAQRAYAAARHALDRTDPADVDYAIGGYTTADLIRLLDSKQQLTTP
jgi:chemotaxis protein methyltransferase CheR